MFWAQVRCRRLINILLHYITTNRTATSQSRRLDTEEHDRRCKSNHDVFCKANVTSTRLSNVLHLGFSIAFRLSCDDSRIENNNKMTVLFCMRSTHNYIVQRGVYIAKLTYEPPFGTSKTIHFRHPELLNPYASYHDPRYGIKHPCAAHTGVFF